MSNLSSPLRVFLVDDEPLALKRLSRLLEATGRVEILGSATDPEDAVAALSKQQAEVLFLDIQMPVLNGFEMLARLPYEPIVIFTTAFDQYALQAFEVNSIDYLLKPVEREQLDRALSKVERLRGGSAQKPEWRAAVEELATALNTKQTGFPNRIASRLGERTQLIEIAQITHFSAENKLTFAVTGTKKYVVDYSINELEQRLDPKVFVRIHRATLLNTNFVREIHQWFAGGVLVRLKDEKRTELAVARDRVRILKDHLSL
ncbi:MAG: response regulator transcription factor [Saprospiraceae bacterium]|nr:response regulator transcription factor [Pyrinomonadaceae bacterium]